MRRLFRRTSELQETLRVGTSQAQVLLDREPCHSLEPLRFPQERLLMALARHGLRERT